MLSLSCFLPFDSTLLFLSALLNTCINPYSVFLSRWVVFRLPDFFALGLTLPFDIVHKHTNTQIPRSSPERPWIFYVRIDGRLGHDLQPGLSLIFFLGSGSDMHPFNNP